MLFSNNFPNANNTGIIWTAEAESISSKDGHFCVTGFSGQFSPPYDPIYILFLPLDIRFQSLGFLVTINTNTLYLHQQLLLWALVFLLNSAYHVFCICWIRTNRPTNQTTKLGRFNACQDFLLVLTNLENCCFCCCWNKNSFRDHNKFKVNICMWGVPTGNGNLIQWCCCMKKCNKFIFFLFKI